MNVFCTIQAPPALGAERAQGETAGLHLPGVLSTITSSRLSGSSMPPKSERRWGVRNPPSSETPPMLSKRLNGTFTGVDKGVGFGSGVPEEEAGLRGGAKPMALPLAEPVLSAVLSREMQPLPPTGWNGLPKLGGCKSATGEASALLLAPTSLGTECALRRAPGRGVGGCGAAWMKVFCTCQRTDGDCDGVICAGIPARGEASEGEAEASSAPAMERCRITGKASRGHLRTVVLGGTPGDGSGVAAPRPKPKPSSSRPHSGSSGQNSTRRGSRLGCDAGGCATYPAKTPGDGKGVCCTIGMLHPPSHPNPASSAPPSPQSSKPSSIKGAPDGSKN
mmetsp:Transcript_159222/g.510786  ORF Transcript_159222/g.510786 Transcript_159222/m.510786 type:complete len:335 (-) Transcript_159222:1455-2459(-)